MLTFLHYCERYSFHMCLMGSHWFKWRGICTLDKRCLCGVKLICNVWSAAFGGKEELPLGFHIRLILSLLEVRGWWDWARGEWSTFWALHIWKTLWTLLFTYFFACLDFWSGIFGSLHFQCVFAQLHEDIYFYCLYWTHFAHPVPFAEFSFNVWMHLISTYLIDPEFWNFAPLMRFCTIAWRYMYIYLFTLDLFCTSSAVCLILFSMYGCTWLALITYHAP